MSYLKSLSWAKFKGASKYNVYVEGELVASTTGSAVYINDLITKKIATGDLFTSYQYSVFIEALNSKGIVIAEGGYSYRYLN